MAVIQNAISKYVVKLGVLDGGVQKTEIDLYQSSKKGSNHIARLKFTEDSIIPAPSWAAPGSMGPITITYPLSRYETIIDLLRNETPLKLVSVQSWKSATIQSGHEPVGEEES